MQIRWALPNESILLQTTAAIHSTPFVPDNKIQQVYQMKRRYQTFANARCNLFGLPREIWTDLIVSPYLSDTSDLLIFANVCPEWRQIVLRVPILNIGDFKAIHPLFKECQHVQDLTMLIINYEAGDTNHNEENYDQECTLYDLRIFLDQNRKTLTKLTLYGRYRAYMPHLYVGASISSIYFCNLQHLRLFQVEFDRIDNILTILLPCKNLLCVVLSDIYIRYHSRNDSPSSFFEALSELDHLEHLVLDVYLRKHSQLSIDWVKLFPLKKSRLRHLYLLNQSIRDENLASIARRCPDLEVIQLLDIEANFTIDGILNLLTLCPKLFSLQFLPIEGESMFRFRPGDMGKIRDASTQIREIKGYDKYYHNWKEGLDDDEVEHQDENTEFQEIVLEALDVSGGQLVIYEDLDE